MKRPLLIAALLLALLRPGASAAGEAPQGRAVFELLGMLQASVARISDGRTVEIFHASEKEAADHFYAVLQEYCKEEHLEPSIQKEVDPDGPITFTSPAIAARLDKYYTKGFLDESIFYNATQADLLRYVEGAYLRFGDGKKQAVITMTNAYEKACTVAVMLSRLGCTNIRVYVSLRLIPPSAVLLFSPGPAVRDALGIRGETDVGGLGFPAPLKLMKTIAPPSTAGAGGASPAAH